jgi:hypothetical protein
MLNIIIYFIGLVLLWKHYNSFVNFYIPEPEKKTKKNMVKYYDNINENKSSQNFFGWALLIYILFGFFAISDGGGECVPNSSWFGVC